MEMEQLKELIIYLAEIALEVENIYLIMNLENATFVMVLELLKKLITKDVIFVMVGVQLKIKNDFLYVYVYLSVLITKWNLMVVLVTDVEGREQFRL